MSSYLVRRLTEELGYPTVDAASLDQLSRQHRNLLLFFAGDQRRYPESDDVAVILPELIAHFGPEVQPAVVLPESEPELRARYPFSEWPALVLLRQGRFVGVITRMQDWSVYLAELERLLVAAPSPLKGVGIPLVEEGSTLCR
ncbi:MAG: hydrogenase-1 expression HyaE [Gammaproteobacteria bacterium]|nr:hydrogenase-1 expression HyaE [Gammaproteobacteria bacterium]